MVKYTTPEHRYNITVERWLC